MERVQIQTTQNVDIDFEVAGLGDRALAAVLDYIIIGSFLFSALIIAAAFGAESVVLYSLLLLPYMLYFFLCEVFMDGQSIGKRVLKLKVVRLDGAQPSVGNYLLRSLIRPIDITFSSGVIGLTSVLVTTNSQRLGDLAAGTTVVKIKPRVRLGETIFASIDESYSPTFYQAEHLSEQDMMTAKEVLNTLVLQRRSHTTYHLGAKAKAALEGKMGVTSDLPPVDFLRTLIQDYNYIHGRV